ncbi:MAG: hypothetical protein ABR587_16410 [Candidatus Binatia bacterium]
MLLATASMGIAAACGDDVDGVRVACACGDLVVSDTILQATDPVVSEPCTADGLLLAAPAGSDGITLDLAGLSIVGRGRGAGIRVARGGRLGCVVVGGGEGDERAEILAFATGIHAMGSHELRELRAIDVHDNRLDGLRIRSSGVRIVDVRADANGGNGVFVSGHGNELADVAADGNAGDGVHVRGSDSTVGAATSGNRRNGTTILGRRQRVKRVVSSANARAGVVVAGTDEDPGTIDSTGNGGADAWGRSGPLQ